MRLIDADALKASVQKTSADIFENCRNCKLLDDWQVKELIDNAQTVKPASPWHRVEYDPPNEKDDAIFYYEWTGISGTVYRETSIVSFCELIALGGRPIAWMEMPEPPKEDA